MLGVMKDGEVAIGIKYVGMAVSFEAVFVAADFAAVVIESVEWDRFAIYPCRGFDLGDFSCVVIAEIMDIEAIDFPGKVVLDPYNGSIVDQTAVDSRKMRRFLFTDDGMISKGIGIGCRAAHASKIMFFSFLDICEVVINATPVMGFDIKIPTIVVTGIAFVIMKLNPSISFIFS